MEARVFNTIAEALGHTPLVKLNRVTAGIKCKVFAKLEHLNPGGSSNDRTALRIIEEAKHSGQLKPGGTIVEATSGNAGAGLAMLAAAKGYRTILTVPDKTSQEKIRMLKAYGAEVIVCPTSVPPDSPESYHSVARAIVQETPSAIFANHYANPQNPEAHYHTTGPEIWEQTAGKITALVCGIGTGGTISGTARFLKEKKPDLKVIGVDPVGSVLHDYFYSQKLGPGAPYMLEGIGEDMIPETLNLQVIDDILTVDDKESFLMARRLAREEGLLVGGSCGSATVATLRIARELPADHLVVTIFPDTGMYYLSKFYSDEWMKENRFLDIEKASVQNLLDSKGSELPSLISVSSGATIHQALELMEKNNISQLAVIDNDQSVGSLDESTLMGRVLEDASLLESPVRGVMEASFPIVHHDDTLEHAKYLLARRYPAILVQEHGKFTGIITKYDLINFMA